ncbi:hypothetical protein K2173_022558 [Erythroxylum novogranatense]|uniref:glutathione transferase n=1 Tax=Erythroxylum novogranatense TaxID=1862640 RepID=A0AAV8TKL6_9ROSI|nr:hypothetical protein K2173_022558 [Erythroxylum novogranatense]
MTIKVHGVPRSTCVARVLLCLQEKGLEYDVVQLNVTAGEHKQQPYLSLHPFGQIPAFEDGDVTLFESRAINKYLANKYKDVGTNLLQSASFLESTIIDLWMEVESQQFNPPMSTIVMQTLVNPIFGKHTDQKIVETELAKLGQVLDVYEERLSKNKYLAGEHYTLADLHHIPYLVYFMKSPHATAVTSRPHVSAWWDTISSRPGTVKVSSEMKF